MLTVAAVIFCGSAQTGDALPLCIERIAPFAQDSLRRDGALATLLPPPLFQDEEASPGLPEALWSLGRTAALDVAYLGTAPLRINGDGLSAFALGVGLVGAVTFVDEQIRHFVQGRRGETLNDVAAATDHLGDGNMPWIVGGSLTALGLLSQDGKLRRTGLEVMENFLIVKNVTTTLKHLFGRRRPWTTDDSSRWKFRGGRDEESRSFPSSRAATVFSVAVIIAEEFPGTVWAAAAYGLAGVVAFDRIVLNFHWTSDVVASALISMAVGKALVWLHAQPDYPPLVPWLSADDGETTMGMSFEVRF
ncbi:MAG: phosphatase PAP2 family protein [Planctomycetes bacterium]|nr:phosphatase PAP2 family protein [Planctomycetota bacterium]